MPGEQPAVSAESQPSGESIQHQNPNQPTVYSRHSRLFESNRFVYPVVSRRSRGVSVGVNLNPDKVCNFDCIYCQVDRRSESETRFVETDQLLDELRSVLQLVHSGDLFEHPKFAATPPGLRRLNDIAFSGDGEPTTFRNFDEIIERAAEVKMQEVGPNVQMVLITNASMFHREHVQRGLRLLDDHNGEIWAKLDAGTEAYYHLIERTKIPFRQVLDNIENAAQVRPLVIQSLFMHVNGVPPDSDEIAAYADRLHKVIRQGGQLKLIQIYTVARQPAESFVTPLSEAQLQQIADTVKQRTALPTAVFP